MKNESSKSIKIDSLNLNLIEYPDLKSSSLSGFIRLNEGNINFIDQRFGWIYKFDLNGKLVSKHLGQGEGPFELNTAFVDGVVNLNNNDWLFMGSSFDIHIHSKDDLERKLLFTLGWVGNSNYADVRGSKTPNPEEFALYTLDYQNLTLRKDSNDNVYIPIYGESNNFNGFQNDRYYKEGRILAKLSLKTGKVEELLGNRSKEYLEYKYVGQHAYFSYDISKKDNFYVSHEIDSLIYVYDKNFKPLYTFGNEGLNMDKNYYEVPYFNMKEIKKAIFDSKPTKGWYSHVEYIDEYDLLFRSYKKNEKDKYDGLQIYKSNKLIADIEVPKNFKVIGSHGNRFYSDAIVVNDTKLINYYFEIPLSLLN